MTREKFCSAINRLSGNLLSDISMFADLSENDLTKNTPLQP